EGIPGGLVQARQAVAEGAGQVAQLLRRRRQPAALGLAREGMDSSRRSPRLVPMVLPLLPGPPAARGGPAPDQALEGDSPARPADRAQLRACGSRMPAAPAPGAASLGLRQPEDLSLLPAFRFPLRIRVRHSILPAIII